MGENIFSISPMSENVVLDPGEVYEGSLKVVNHVDSQDDLHFKVSVLPYGVADENYTADLVSMTNMTEMVKWIKIDEPTGVVKPNESSIIHYRIEVPSNAPGGGQYALIAVSSDPENSEENMITSVLELASVIYARVNGETTHGGSILENIVPGFSFVPEVPVGTMIENTGNVHEYASVQLEVKNFFTGEIIYPTKEEEGEFSEIIMPETTRYISRVIDNGPKLGVMHVSQMITYNGDVSIVEKNVIVCPLWFLILVVFTFFVLVSIVIMKIRQVRRRKAEV